MHSVPLKRKSLDTVGIAALERAKIFEKNTKKLLTSRGSYVIIIEHALGLGANYAQNPFESEHDMR